jgi:hypothetical protein
MTCKNVLRLDEALDRRPWLLGTSSGSWPAAVHFDGLGAVDFGELVDPEDQATLRGVVAAVLASGREVSVEYRRSGDVERWMIEELRPLPSGYATLVRRAGPEALLDSSRRILLAIVAHDLANVRFVLRSAAAAVKAGVPHEEVGGDLAHVVERAGDVTANLMILSGGKVEPSQVELRSVLTEITRIARHLFEEREIVVTTTGPEITRRVERSRLVALVASLLARGLRRPHATEDVRITLHTEAPDRFELSIEHPSSAPLAPADPLSERSVVTHAKALGMVLQLDENGARIQAR